MAAEGAGVAVKLVIVGQRRIVEGVRALGLGRHSRGFQGQSPEKRRSS